MGDWLARNGTSASTTKRMVSLIHEDGILLLRQHDAGAGDALDPTLPMRVSVVVATWGRPGAVAALIEALALQTLQPDSIIVSCATAADAGTVGTHPRVSVVTGRAGLTRQRNAGLARLGPGTEVVVFFDDDFLPHPGWLAAAAAAFAAHSTLAAVTGELVEAQTRGTEVSHAEARVLLAGWRGGGAGTLLPIESPYGCNMAFRCAAITGLRFDERLAAYGWLEDFDFGAQVARRGGGIARIGGAAGVHLQASSARISGDQFGYAQVVNPLYLVRKGTMPLSHAVRQIWRDVSANAWRARSRDTAVDHRGRWRGNLRGFVAMLAGHLAPERVEAIKPRRIR